MVVSQPVPLDNGTAIVQPPPPPPSLPDGDHLESQQSSSKSQSRQRRVWTPEEDEKLRLLVSYWGDQCGKNGHWDKISAHFDHRSNKDCRKRWFHSLDPKLKRGRWTEHEDKVLIEAYEKMGPVWHRIAQLIPGRTDDQCSKRYNDVLDPNISTRLRPWTPEEDQLLLDLVQKKGTQWRKIANEMDGRTGLTCRNRWRKISAKKEKENNQHRHHHHPVPQAESAATNAMAAAMQIQHHNNATNSTTILPSGAPLSNLNMAGIKDEESPLSMASAAASPESSISSMSNKRSPMITNTSSSVSPANNPSASLQPSKPPKPIPPPLEPADSTTTTTHYTFSVDPEAKEQHSLTPRELEELIQIAKKHGHPITVHQHNYHHHHYHNGAGPAAASAVSSPAPPAGLNTTLISPAATTTTPQNHAQHQLSKQQQPHSLTQHSKPPQQQQVSLSQQIQIPPQQQHHQVAQSSSSQPQAQQPPQPQPSGSGSGTQHHLHHPKSRSQTPISASMSAAPTPGTFFNMDMLNSNIIPEFDEELGLDFDAFDGIPFNPS